MAEPTNQAIGNPDIATIGPGELRQTLNNPPRPQKGQARAITPTSRVQQVGEFGLGAGIGAMIDKISAIEDPLSRQIAQQLVAKAVGFKIPTRAELEIQQLALSQKKNLLMVGVAKSQIDNVIAGLLDAGFDEKILGDPEQLMRLAKEAGVPISKGMMFLAGRVAADTETPLDRLKRADEFQKKFESVSEGILATAAGETNAGKLIDSIVATHEELAGADIGGIGSDIDELEGAQGLAAVIDDVLKKAPQIVGDEKTAVEILIEKFGPDIADQLEGLGKNDKGQLIVGNGDLGVEDRATTLLVSTLVRLAAESGTSPIDVMRRIGLTEYTGIDQESFAQSLTEEANTKSDPGGFVLGLLGGKAIERLQDIFAAKETAKSKSSPAGEQ